MWKMAPQVSQAVQSWAPRSSGCLQRSPAPQLLDAILSELSVCYGMMELELFCPETQESTVIASLTAVTCPVGK